MLNYVINIVNKIVSLTSGLKKFLLGIWTFFIPVQSYLFIILFMVIIDIIFGILAAKKQGLAFKSRVLRKGLLEKVGLYLVLFVILFFLDILTMSAFKHDVYWCAFAITFFISIYEISSIIEKLLIIKPNMPLIGRLGKLFKDLPDKALDKLESGLDKKLDELTGNDKNKTDENIGE